MSHATRKASELGISIILVAAIVIGGGTGPGLISDSLLLMAAILVCGTALFLLDEHEVDGRIIALALAACVAVAIQVLPLPELVLHKLRPAAVRNAMDVSAGQIGNTFGTLSLVTIRTLDYLVFTIAATLLLWSSLRLPAHRVYHLVKPLFIGIAINAILAPLVLATGDRGTGITGIFDHPLRGGTFSNVNHLATLLFTAIPFIIYFGFRARRTVITMLGLAYIMVLLLAAGSMAGLFIGTAVALAALVLAVRSMSEAHTRLPLLMIAVWAAISIAGVWYRFDALTADSKLSRSEYARVSFNAIKENPVFGTGYGTFETTYPIYEPADSIGLAIVNHVHNDVIELVYEGGMIAAALIIVYLALLGLRLFQQRHVPFMRAIGIAIIGILAHSLVDYPMRTVAMLFVFVTLNAMLFHRGLAEYVETLVTPDRKKDQVPEHHRRGRKRR